MADNKKENNGCCPEVKALEALIKQGLTKHQALNALKSGKNPAKDSK